MATATLVLGSPVKVTLESTATNLREVVVPAKCGELLITCDEAIFIEKDTGQSDAGAGTAADQFKLRAGSHALRPAGTQISLFVAATSASQEIWLWAVR